MASTRDFNGKWALITGASAGIGVALARELAGCGAKLILTARRKDRLEALAAELAAQGDEVRIVTADLNDPAAPQQIYDATEGAGLDVDILINNAGLGQFGAFIAVPWSRNSARCASTAKPSSAFRACSFRAWWSAAAGWVLITASTASFQPMPYISTYAATKAFDRFFALGLAQEVAPLWREGDGALPRTDRERVLRCGRCRCLQKARRATGRRCGAHRHRRAGARQAHSDSHFGGQSQRLRHTLPPHGLHYLHGR